MKKLIGALCVFTVIISLSGCSESKNVSGGDNKQKESLSSVANGGNSDVEEIPAPYETLTDKSEFAIPASDQSYNIETDSQYYFQKVNNSFDIAQTDDTLFFYNSYLGESYLRMIDKTNKSVKAFCSRPECSHATGECSSCFKNAKGMFYYNGFLYIMLQEYINNEDTWNELQLNLYRVSLETQERKKIKSIAKILTDGTNPVEYSIVYIQHRGYLYYMYTVGTGGEKDHFFNYGSNSLYRISIEEDTEKECIANMDREDGFILSFLKLQASGSYIYYMIPDKNGIGEIYRFNTETLKNEALNIGKIATENFVIWDGDIYYKKDWKETLIYKISSDTLQEELFTDTKKSGYESSSNYFGFGDYLAVTCFNGTGEDNYYTNHCYNLFNKSGEVVAEIELPVQGSVEFGGSDILVSYDIMSMQQEEHAGSYADSEKGNLLLLNINDIKKNGEDNVFEKIELN